MLKRSTLVFLIALCAVACSKEETAEQRQAAAGAAAKGSDDALPSIRQAVRVWRRERPTVDLVAAELEGVIMARTTAQALMHYPGYRIILTTPGEVVTRIVFQFDDAKPSISQLTELFGKPEEIRKGMLYTNENVTTGQMINILAQPVTMPAEEGTLVKGLIIEGARRR